jgi:predicted GNAT family acetyltransferase
MKQIINPSMFAMQSANQEYDGSIAGLARQIATNQTQGQQNVRDIGNWYTQAGNQQKAGAQANVALGNNVAQGLENNNSAIVAALGANPDAAAGVGNWNATLAAGLKGDAQATQAFDNQMGGFLAAQGAAAKTSEQNQMQNLAKELAAQRTGLIKEKGQARSKYRAEAEQQRFQQLAAVQNMALGASQMGVDLDLKNAQLKGQGLSNDLDQMKLDYARDQMTESGQDDPSKLPLDSRMKLVQALKGSVTSRGKSGAPMAKPQTLYSRFAAEMGLDTQNAGHRKFLLQVLRSLYPNVQKYPFNFTK